MDFIKKISISGYIMLASAIFALVALIISGISASVIGYAIENIGLSVFLSIAAVLIIVAGVVFTAKSDNKTINGIASILAAILMLFSIIIVMIGRASLFVYVFVVAGPAEVSAFGTSVACLALYILSFLGLAVSSFMEK